ncbi:hypothetical protein [Sorangium sp. So ce406]|uniref:hypothetical protein n=1 Tax=Sorangium sp. So ce406 TaxID=3133311 RepID=UPI003F5BFBA2
MGRSVSIDLRIPGLRSNVYRVLCALLEAGWSYDDDGHISYLPVGDRGDFDWQWADLDRWPDVLAAIKVKEERGELVGVSLIHEETGAGGEFLLDAREELLMICLTINTRDIQTVPRFVDFTWYLERLVPAISRAGFTIECVECCQH